jgi:hypothetical protein
VAGHAFFCQRRQSALEAAEEGQELAYHLT